MVLCMFLLQKFTTKLLVDLFRSLRLNEDHVRIPLSIQYYLVVTSPKTVLNYISRNFRSSNEFSLGLSFLQSFCLLNISMGKYN